MSKRLATMRLLLASLILLGNLAVAGTTVRISSCGKYTSYITEKTAESSVSATSSITLSNLKLIAETGDSYQNTALLGIKIASNSDYSISTGMYTVDGVATTQLRIYDKAAGSSISGDGKTFTWTDDEGSALTSAPDLNNINLEGAVRGAITLGYNSSSVLGVVSTENQGTAVVFSILYENGDVLSYFGINYAQQWKSGHVASITYDSDVLNCPEISVWSSSPWTRDTLIAANEAALTAPEPTTATLSLLALMGLAARRRRKAA